MHSFHEVLGNIHTTKYQTYISFSAIQTKCNIDAADSNGLLPYIERGKSVLRTHNVGQMKTSIPQGDGVDSGTIEVIGFAVENKTNLQV